MSPGAVTIDTTVDFNPAPMSNPAAPQARNLLLAPPSIAAHEEKLRGIFTTYDRENTDLQMLDRLTAGFVSLAPATYDLVLVLTDTDGSRRTEALQLLTRDVYSVLVPAMKPGAKLQLQDGKGLTANEGLEAILAGLVQKDDGFEKMAQQEAAVPLKLGGRKKKEAPAAQINTGVVNLTSTNDLEGDEDELINEDELLSEEDMKRPVQQPSNCDPKTAKKRRRACKDCTCGLASQLEEEDAARQTQAAKDLKILKLQAEELEEVDFTVQGKTGSCNSCSLGDAFRCAGCPYIGLPPFRPGEEIRIMNDVQL